MKISVKICLNCKRYWDSDKEVCTCGYKSFSPNPASNYTAIEWTVTDPDNYQMGRKIGERTYEFKEFDWNAIAPEKPESLTQAKKMDNWISDIIDLDDYTPEQIQNHISAYYKDLEELKATDNSESWEWIVAECIFEQESELY